MLEVITVCKNMLKIDWFHFEDKFLHLEGTWETFRKNLASGTTVL